MVTRVHLITGGFPAGSSAGHDMDYARRQLLGYLAELPDVVTTVANNYADLDTWLIGCQLLVTYVAGPVPDAAAHAYLQDWLAGGGRWFALHGTSGGRAARVEGSRQRSMVREPHHATLGCFFLNHPPLRRFDVAVHGDHVLTAGLPTTFTTTDELYLVEPIGTYTPLLTTELPSDPSPPGFGFSYAQDTSLLPDGRTRVLGYVREHGRGAVAYVALGHCHHPLSNAQPFVDPSLAADGATPATFHGSWELAPFEQLLRNALRWGTQHAGA